MSWIKKLTLIQTILTIAVVSVSCNSDSSVTSYQKNLDFNRDSKNYYTSLSDKTNDLVYAACDQNNKKCKVTVESPSNFSSKSCDVDVSASWWNSHFDVDYYLQQFDSNNILLVKYYTKVFLGGNDQQGSTVYSVRISDCHVSQISLPSVQSTWKGKIQARYEKNAFDLYFATREKMKSGIDCENKICKVTANLDGKVIQGPEEYLPNYDSRIIGAYPLLTNQSASNSTYFVKYTRVDGLTRVHNGFGTKLYSKNTSQSEFTTSNSKVGFCQDNRDYTFRCGQYDLNGKLLLSLNFKNSDFVDDSKNWFRFVPYNLRNGGMIIGMVERTFRDDNNFIHKLKFIPVRKDGKYLLPPLEIPYDEFNIVRLSATEYSENDKQLCFKLLSAGKVYRIECISKNNF